MSIGSATIFGLLDRDDWVDRVAPQRRDGPLVIACLVTLQRYTNDEFYVADPGGNAYPVHFLANESRLALPTMREFLRRLTLVGVLQRDEVPRGSGIGGPPRPRYKWRVEPAAEPNGAAAGEPPRWQETAEHGGGGRNGAHADPLAPRPSPRLGDDREAIGGLHRASAEMTAAVAFARRRRHMGTVVEQVTVVRSELTEPLGDLLAALDEIADRGPLPPEAATLQRAVVGFLAVGVQPGFGSSRWRRAAASGGRLARRRPARAVEAEHPCC